MEAMRPCMSLDFADTIYYVTMDFASLGRQCQNFTVSIIAKYKMRGT